MPSEPTAGEIRRSLAEGEHFEDFAYLFDALIFLRRPYGRDVTVSESVVGRLLCVIFPDKPARYVRAMQGFRLGFFGVSEDRELQAEFSNSVRRAAIALSRPEDIVWRPSFYFSLPPRLRDSRQVREWWA